MMNFLPSNVQNFNNNSPLPNDPNADSTTEVSIRTPSGTSTTGSGQGNQPRPTINKPNFAHLSRSTPDVNNMAASSAVGHSQHQQQVKQRITKNQGALNLDAQAGPSNQVSALSFTSVASKLNVIVPSTPERETRSNANDSNTQNPAHPNTTGHGTQTSWQNLNATGTGVQQILNDIENLSFQTPQPPHQTTTNQTQIQEGRVDFSVPVSQTTQTNQTVQNQFQLPAVQPNVQVYHAAEHAYEQYTTNLIRRCTLKVISEYFQQVFDHNLVPEWTVTYVLSEM